MKRLRRPIRAIGEPFGKAGLTVAILALVLAMGGAAFAASAALSGKQRKEVQKIAKGYAGRPGVTGPAGPAGPAGKNGARGAEGLPGADGVGVTTAAASGAECPSGGVKVSSAGANAKVCDGTTGFTETLPSGKTETGAFDISFQVPSQLTEEEEENEVEEEGTLVQSFASPLSFAIPLAEPLAAEGVHFLSTEEQEEGTGPASCPGTAEIPLAQAGNLCLYQGATRIGAAEEESFSVVKILPPTAGISGSPQGAGTTGADPFVAYHGGRGLAYMQGAWALTAP
jgi:hypothetical protein